MLNLIVGVSALTVILVYLCWPRKVPINEDYCVPFDSDHGTGGIADVILPD